MACLTQRERYELAVERRGTSEGGGRVAGKDPAGRRCSMMK